jgi:hypothetical protein
MKDCKSNLSKSGCLDYYDEMANNLSSRESIRSGFVGNPVNFPYETGIMGFDR